MNRKNILLFAIFFEGMLMGYAALADSRTGPTRAEYSPQNQWSYSHTTQHGKSHNGNQSSRHRLKINTWNRDQHRSENSRSKSHRTGNDRADRSPGRDFREGKEQRRSPPPSNDTPPPRQQRTKHRPDHRSDNRPDTRSDSHSGNRSDDRRKDHGDKPPRKEHRRPDTQHDQHRSPQPRKEHRPEHRPEKRHDDRHHNPRRDHRPNNKYKPHRPPRHDHRHHHRPNYRLYKRHKYIYYWTPWYNTWFLAPIYWPYHRIGFTLEILPSPYIRIVVGGLPYYYASGTFYRPYRSGYIVVAAPIGAVVTTLPPGYIAFSVGLSTYYFANDAYYVWDEPRDAFVVVPKPEGAEHAIEEATRGRLYAYPKHGQSAEQQAKDRYECHRWAVSESDVDPTLEEQDYTDTERRDYKRAIAACLEGRGYAVK